jgi:hypothetical protein
LKNCPVRGVAERLRQFLKFFPDPVRETKNCVTH